MCTNVACALVGAGDTLREFERELGDQGRRDDRRRRCSRCATVECYGGCGWGPVVSVDERYHEPCGPEKVAALVAELRGRR